MKRLWIAALLLAVLFGATLCNNLYLRGFTGALTPFWSRRRPGRRPGTGGSPRPHRAGPHTVAVPGQLPAHPPAPFRHRSDLYRFSGGARVPHLPGGRGVLRRQRPAHDPVSLLYEAEQFTLKNVLLAPG